MTRCGLWLVAPLLTAGLIACIGQGPTDATPEGAVTLFVQAVSERPRDRQGAYELLAPATQKALQKRATVATKQAGRKIRPAELLAVERAVILWKIEQMDTEIDGDRATVTARGAQEGQSAKISLRRVDGRWRIVLPL